MCEKLKFCIRAILMARRCCAALAAIVLLVLQGLLSDATGDGGASGVVIEKRIGKNLMRQFGRIGRTNKPAAKAKHLKLQVDIDLHVKRRAVDSPGQAAQAAYSCIGSLLEPLLCGHSCAEVFAKYPPEQACEFTYDLGCRGSPATFQANGGWCHEQSTLTDICSPYCKDPYTATATSNATIAASDAWGLYGQDPYGGTVTNNTAPAADGWGLYGQDVYNTSSAAADAWYWSPPVQQRAQRQMQDTLYMQQEMLRRLNQQNQQLKLQQRRQDPYRMTAGTYPIADGWRDQDAPYIASPRNFTDGWRDPGTYRDGQDGAWDTGGYYAAEGTSSCTGSMTEPLLCGDTCAEVMETYRSRQQVCSYTYRRGCGRSAPFALYGGMCHEESLIADICPNECGGGGFNMTAPSSPWQGPANYTAAPYQNRCIGACQEPLLCGSTCGEVFSMIESSLMQTNQALSHGSRRSLICEKAYNLGCPGRRAPFQDNGGNCHEQSTLGEICPSMCSREAFRAFGTY